MNIPCDVEDFACRSAAESGNAGGGGGMDWLTTLLGGGSYDYESIAGYHMVWNPITGSYDIQDSSGNPVETGGASSPNTQQDATYGVTVEAPEPIMEVLLVIGLILLFVWVKAK